MVTTITQLAPYKLIPGFKGKQELLSASVSENSGPLISSE